MGDPALRFLSSCAAPPHAPDERKAPSGLSVLVPVGHNQRMQRRRLATLIALAALAGCASKEKLPPGQYMEQAEQSFHGGSLSLAIEQYKELIDQHPFSEHNELAEVRVAHAHYLNGSYPEAVVALTDFQRRHPTSPHLAFVGYLLGMCYVQQIDTIDRDHTAAQNAQSYFMTMAQQFPSSPFAELARQRLAQCRDHLAAHELYVADYYEGQGNSRAAEIRRLELAMRYRESSRAARALLQLGRMYESRDRTDEAALAYRALVQLHPRSDEAVQVRSSLAADAPPTDVDANDPLAALLAMNGRELTDRDSESAPIPVPGLEPSRGPRMPSGVPMMGGGFDPFGRSNRGRPF